MDANNKRFIKWNLNDHAILINLNNIHIDNQKPIFLFQGEILAISYLIH